LLVLLLITGLLLIARLLLITLLRIALLRGILLLGLLWITLLWWVIRLWRVALLRRLVLLLRRGIGDGGSASGAEFSVHLRSTSWASCHKGSFLRISYFTPNSVAIQTIGGM
jgi:hypothetical protein